MLRHVLSPYDVSLVILCSRLFDYFFLRVFKSDDTLLCIEHEQVIRALRVGFQDQ